MRCSLRSAVMVSMICRRAISAYRCEHIKVAADFLRDRTPNNRVEEIVGMHEEKNERK